MPSFSSWEKIGRLRPNEDNNIDIDSDESGIIGVITYEELKNLTNGTGPLTFPWGTLGLSASTKGCNFSVTEGELFFVAIETQVENMLIKFPTKKAALWRPITITL